MEKDLSVNNGIYNEYGERWYTAYDDPIAFLRAETKVKCPWIMERLENHFHQKSKVLDVGCGGGFLSNELAFAGHEVTGLDLSTESLRVARHYDKTQSVNYISGNAYELPFPDHSFDAVTAMDFLEHVDDPEAVIKEISRVLRPGGLFFFHTFNRNFVAWLVVIKLLEWFIKNTPKNMHVINLFIKPKELSHFCQKTGMVVQELSGLRPVVSSFTWKMLFTGVVSKTMRFKLCRSTLISYIGYAIKK